jgi:hypothetical protein
VDDEEEVIPEFQDDPLTDAPHAGDRCDR